MKIVIILMMVFASTAWSTVTVGVQDCPIQFEGRVKEIIEPIGTVDYFATNRVVFENQKTLKGDVSSVVHLDVLQNGPFKIETDKDYRVHLRSGKMCWIEEI